MKAITGKILGLFIREDKPILRKLCQIRGDFAIIEDRAYCISPTSYRLVRFPLYWPSIFQRWIAVILYEENDPNPVGWIHLKDKKLLDETEKSMIGGKVTK